MNTLLVFALSRYNSFSTNVPASHERCLILAAVQPFPAKYNPSWFILRSTNMRQNELTPICDLSFQDGKGNTWQQTTPRCFSLTACPSTGARTVPAPSRLLHPLCLLFPLPAALDVQHDAPVARLLSKKGWRRPFPSSSLSPSLSPQCKGGSWLGDRCCWASSV